jgi:hypothetical protein
MRPVYFGRSGAMWLKSLQRQGSRAQPALVTSGFESTSFAMPSLTICSHANQSTE